MVNITLAIPNELHAKMKQHSEIRWSEVVRKIIEKRISDLELMNKIVSGSKLTRKDAEEIAEKIDESVARKIGLYSKRI